MAQRSMRRERRRQIRARRRFSTGWPDAPSSCAKDIATSPVRVPCRRYRRRWPAPNGCNDPAGRLWPRSSSGTVAARVGAGLTARPLAHQNGQAPLLGAVGAGARARGLNGDQASLALRIGAILVLTPSYTNAVAGATALNVAGGSEWLRGNIGARVGAGRHRRAAERRSKKRLPSWSAMASAPRR